MKFFIWKKENKLKHLHTRCARSIYKEQYNKFLQDENTKTKIIPLFKKVINKYLK